MTNATVGCNGKKYTGLSAIILMVFAQNSLKNKSFSASGYDLTLILKHLRLNFSHQQIYREVKNITLLKCEIMPQEGKPDRKVYTLVDNSRAAVEEIQQHIDFNPKRTNPKVFLAFELPSIVMMAINSYRDFIDSEKRADQKIQEKLEQNGEVTEGGTNVRNFEFQLHDATLGALSSHVDRLLKVA